MNIPFFNKKKTDQQVGKEKKKQKETWVRVCPNCLSPDLKFVPEFTSGWLTPAKYYCPNCQYSGQLYLEIDINELKDKTPQELRTMLDTQEDYKELVNSEKNNY